MLQTNHLIHYCPAFMRGKTDTRQTLKKNILCWHPSSQFEMFELVVGVFLFDNFHNSHSFIWGHCISISYRKISSVGTVGKDKRSLENLQEYGRRVLLNQTSPELSLQAVTTRGVSLRFDHALICVSNEREPYGQCKSIHLGSQHKFSVSYSPWRSYRLVSWLQLAP